MQSWRRNKENKIIHIPEMRGVKKKGMTYVCGFPCYTITYIHTIVLLHKARNLNASHAWHSTDFINPNIRYDFEIHPLLKIAKWKPTIMIHYICPDRKRKIGLINRSVYPPLTTISHVSICTPMSPSLDHSSHKKIRNLLELNSLQGLLKIPQHCRGITIQDQDHCT